MPLSNVMTRLLPAPDALNDNAKRKDRKIRVSLFIIVDYDE